MLLKWNLIILEEIDFFPFFWRNVLGHKVWLGIKCSLKKRHNYWKRKCSKSALVTNILHETMVDSEEMKTHVFLCWLYASTILSIILLTVNWSFYCNLSKIASHSYKFVIIYVVYSIFQFYHIFQVKCILLPFVIGNLHQTSPC